MNWSVGELFVRGGWVMWPLLTFSVLLWAVVLERAVIFVTLRPRLTRLVERLRVSLRAGDLAAARQLVLAEKPQLAELFLPALDGKSEGTRDRAERVTERGRARLTGYLRKHLWILGTIGTASPFIGLLGTVVGILHSFHKMAEQGAGGFSVVAAGISEALIATAAGLVVAILALIGYNIFVNAANQLLAGLRITLDELLDYSFPEKSKSSS